ncbi:2135_t:CDS:2 [Funneliformis geosporum]|uniref:2135_t:CDS:1 n=1 Tax=Funneliformis geosporum TaxID=1117311 RepID=A0A9W4SXA3_9GLOM|nr:2135_t:CDS:2 [Funneliformis geosporum]
MTTVRKGGRQTYGTLNSFKSSPKKFSTLKVTKEWSDKERSTFMTSQLVKLETTSAED